MLIVVATFVLMAWELLGDYFLAVYFSILAIALMETKGGPYSPFHGYPLWFNLGAAFFFLSVYLFHMDLRRSSSNLQWGAAGAYFCSLLFYEVFLFYIPIFVCMAWFLGGTKPAGVITSTRMALIKIFPTLVAVSVYVILYLSFNHAHPSSYAGMALSLASAGSIVITIIQFSVSGLNLTSALHFKGRGDLNAIAAACAVFVISAWVIHRLYRAISERQRITIAALAVIAMPLPNILYGFIEKYRIWARTSNPSNAFYIGSFYSAFPFAIALGCIALLLAQLAARLRLMTPATVTISAALGWLTFTNVVEADRFYAVHHDNRKLWELVDDSLLTAREAYGPSGIIVAPSLLRMPLLDPYIYDYWSFYYSDRLGRSIHVISSPEEVASQPGQIAPGSVFAFVPRYYPGLRAGFYAVGPIDIESWKQHPTQLMANHVSIGVIGETNGLCVSLGSPGARMLTRAVSQRVAIDSQHAVNLNALVLDNCSSGGRRVNAADKADSPRQELMVVPAELKEPPTVIVNQAAIDIVNEMGRDKGDNSDYIFHATTSGPLWVRGWAYDDTHKTVPATVWLEFSNHQSGQRFFIPAERLERPDVAEGFKIPWARRSGFATQMITGHNIPRGEYDVKIFQIQRGIAELTRYYAARTITVMFE